MISMTDAEWSLSVLNDLRDLGRNALAGRAICRDHILNISVEPHNVSTYYLTVVVLNRKYFETTMVFEQQTFSIGYSKQS